MNKYSIASKVVTGLDCEENKWIKFRHFVTQLRQNYTFLQQGLRGDGQGLFFFGRGHVQIKDSTLALKTQDDCHS